MFANSMPFSAVGRNPSHAYGQADAKLSLLMNLFSLLMVRCIARLPSHAFRDGRSLTTQITRVTWWCKSVTSFE